MGFDYYYGAEAEQFSFYRIPRTLIKDKRFKLLSSDAKILYGLMLDRMAMSMRNGWLDYEGRVYICYSIEDIAEDLGCSRPTAIKVLAELDGKKGIGLLEKKRQGQGKHDLIYVKNFVKEIDQEDEDADETSQEVDSKRVSDAEVKNSSKQKYVPASEIDSRRDNIPVSEVKKFHFQKSKNLTSKSKKFELQEVKDFDPNNNIYINNNINHNYNNMSYNNPINQSKEMNEIDEMNQYIELIKENVEFEYHMKYDSWNDKQMYAELVEMLCETVCVKQKTVRINGANYPHELVKSKFLKLDSGHLKYVMECMKKITTPIANIRAYILTSLFNAPSTHGHWISNQFQCDRYNGLI